MSTFRKKPVEIEARQLTGDTAADHEIYQWVERQTQGSFDPLSDEVPATGVSIDPATGFFLIATLEGVMQAKIGDWIIRGVKGEFYPCKPDIFAATYDEVDAGVHRDDIYDAAVERFFTASEHPDVVALRNLIVPLGAAIDAIVPARPEQGARAHRPRGRADAREPRHLRAGAPAVILGVGTAVVHQERVWTVIEVRQQTRVLRSLDGRTVAYEAVDRLTEAP